MKEDNILSREASKQVAKQLNKQLKHTEKTKVSLKTIGYTPIVTFSLAMAATLVITSMVALHSLEIERFTMGRLAMERSSRLSLLIERILQRGYIFGQLVTASHEDLENLGTLAYNLANDEAIMSLSIAPGGVVAHVFPFYENEVIIGLDFFSSQT